MTSVPHNIKLKIGCDGVTDVKFHPQEDKLVVGTVGGRIRIYDCSYEDPIELFRKRWHKNLTRLAVSKCGTKIISSSSQGSIKQHNFETGDGTWTCLRAHTDSVSSLIWQTDHLFISGDEGGNVKIWDDRQENPICDIDVSASEMVETNEYLSAVNDLVVDNNSRHLFIAMDDGNLVTVNLRARKVEMCSESLSYSAKSIVTFKQQTKLAVGTDEGVISIFNWKEFGNLSDRFPISTADDPIERLVSLSENVVAVATASGSIKASSLLPNLVLTDIGKHSFSNGAADCGDCIAIAVNSDQSFLVSGCPESDIVCFYSPEVAVRESALEKTDRSKNKKKKDRAVTEERRKRQRQLNNGFLDAMVEGDDDCAASEDLSSDSDSDD